MKKLHPITPDLKKNPALARECAEVRGMIVAQAEKNPLPKRFQASKDNDKPRMILRDLETGRKTCVPLFAYGEVRRTLSALFG